MRGWQEDLHREVFSKVGLLRYGPRRARLSRPDYLKAKQTAEELAETAVALKDIKTFKEAASSIAVLLDEREANIDEREDILDARETQVAGLKTSLEKRSEELRKTAEKTAVVAQETATRAAGFAEREDALKVRESKAADREAKVERREEKVDEREKRSMERATELDASLATVEAMTAGLAEYDETVTSPGMRSTAAAKSDSAWPNMKARMKAAPEAALATAGRLSKSLSAIRAKAVAEGLTEARKSALDELRDAFQAIRNASTSLGAVNDFTKGLIARLIDAPQRKAEERELDRLAKIAGTDVFKAKFVATKSGLRDDAIE
jgi:chromosome segregation ATPase